MRKKLDCNEENYLPDCLWFQASHWEAQAEPAARLRWITYNDKKQTKKSSKWQEVFKMPHQVMLDRRLMQDDNRGLFQGVQVKM